MPVCTICEDVLPSIQGLFLHYKLRHEKLTNSFFSCGEDGCNFKKYFQTWSRMRRHCRCQHNFNNYATGSKDDVALEKHGEEEMEDESAMTLEVENSLPGENLLNPLTDEPFLSNLSEVMDFQAAKLISKLYARPSFPRNLIQIVVDGFTDFLNETTEVLKSKLKKSSEINDKDKSVPLNDVIGMLDIFSLSFSQFSSEYRRMKYFKNSGCLVPAKDCTVRVRYEHKLVDNRIVKVLVPCLAKLVSLESILKCFFTLPGNLQTVLNYVETLKNNKTVISNFIQGSLWQKKSAPYEAEGKLVLPLFIGIDDLEINNVLGSHAGLNEMGAVYATIPCLPPEFFSQLENIFLVYLYNSQDRKAVMGNKEVFSHLVQELNYLAREGIEIKTDDEENDLKIYFVVGLILGDNKGLNEVLGFSGSFSANFYCRFCKRHKSDCANDVEEKPDFARQVLDYENDVSSGLRSTGVNERSVWVELDYFHPVENFASCTLHDFDEGVSKYAMIEICKYFIFEVKVFSLQLLNSRIKSFNYQVNGFTNKVPEITEDNLKNSNLKMSGIEMRNFVLSFNVLVGDYVPLNDDVWLYYLILRRLVECIACKSLPRNALNSLCNLIKEHNTVYKNLFGLLKPKMHLLVHY